MDTSSNPLAELRDIHLPSEVSYLPLAFGWYLVLGLLLALAAIWGVIYLRKKRYLARYNRLNNLLTEIENQYSLISDAEIIGEVSILLKRIARDKYPQENPQMLIGDAWLAFLNKTGKTLAFSEGVGVCLANTYQRQELTQKDEFFQLVRDWIRGVA